MYLVGTNTECHSNKIDAYRRYELYTMLFSLPRKANSSQLHYLQTKMLYYYWHSAYVLHSALQVV